MNAVTEDIKDLLVAETGMVFGTDLFINVQPPTPVNCVTLYDTSSRPSQAGMTENVFMYESIQIIIRNDVYSAGMLIAQGIISVLNNRANFTVNETWYLYCNLMNGPNSLGTQEGAHLLSLNFNLQRKSGIAPAGAFLTFARLVQILLEGENVTLQVDTENETITIGATGGGGGTISMRNTGTYIQYSNDGGETWNNLISVADLKGDKGDKGDPGEQGIPGQDGTDGTDGREVEFNKSATHIQWRYVGETVWIDLVALVDLKGDQGDPGVTNIQDAEDVDKSAIGNDKILVYNSTSGKHEYQDKPSGGLDKTFQTLTEAATITFDASVSVNGSVTLTASRILGNITNAVPGEIHCVKVIQGGSGSYTLTYGNQYKFSGGVLPILSATVNAVDLLFFLAVSTSEFHFINANFDVKTP